MPVSAPPKKRVGALGVLAELETIEPILRRHQQETQTKLAQSLNPKIRAILPALGIKSTDEEQFIKITEEISQETARQVVENSAIIQAPEEAQLIVADSLAQTLSTHPQISDKLKISEEKLLGKALKETAEITINNQEDLEKTAVLSNLAQLAKIQKPDQKFQETIAQNIQSTVERESPMAAPATQETIKGSLGVYLATYGKELAKRLPEISQTTIPTLKELQEIKSNAHEAATARLGTTLSQTPAGKQIGSAVGYKNITDNFASSNGLIAPFTRPASAAPKKLPLATRVILSNPKHLSRAYLSLLAHDQEKLAQALRENSKIIEQLKNKKSLTFKEKKGLYLAQKKYQKYTKAQAFQIKKARLAKTYKTILAKNYQGGVAAASSDVWSAEYRLNNFAPDLLVTNERLAAGAVFGSLGFSISGVSPGSFISAVKGQISSASLVSFGMGMTPIGVFSRFGTKIRNIAGAAFGGIMLYLMSLGQAAATGALIGAAIGGVSGAALGFLAPPILWPVTVPLGFFVGGSMGGIAGAMTALGLATGSTTLAATGIGMTAGAGIGAVVGFGLGGPIGAAAGAFLGYFVGAAVGYAAGQLIATIGASASGALAGAAIGFYIGGPVGALAGAGIGYLVTGGWSQLKNFLSVGATTGGGVLGSVAGLIKGAISTIAGGFSSGIGGALGALSGAANFVVGGLTSISIPSTGAVVLLTAGPVAGVGLLTTLTITTAAVSFATIASDEPTEIITPGENQFFTLTKTAQPETLGNSDLPTEIKFTITLRAKDTNLANIQITDELKVQRQSGTFIVATDKDGRPISPPCFDTAPSTLLANNSWTCELTIVADRQPSERGFSNSLVANTVTVRATPDGQSEITDNTTATVVIGNPPTLCAFLDIQGSWSQAERNNINAVCQTLDRSPKIISLLRNAGTIDLVKGASRDDGVCGTVNGSRTITVYCDMSSLPFAKYVIIHELGHVLGNYNFSIYNSFIRVYEQEGLMPTYPFGGSGPGESFAEMITEYVVSKEYNHPARPWSNYPGGPWVNPGNSYTTFENDRPLHYNFAKNQIYEGVQY